MPENDKLISTENTNPQVYVPSGTPFGCVTIRTDRFQELVQSEMELEVIRHAYRYMESYRMDHVLDAIFNPAFKYKGDGGHAE